MRIYLVRHGEAGMPGGGGEPALTAMGVRQAESTADDAARTGVRVARVVHSGKLRARQTAEILAARLSPPGGVAAMDGLGPDSDVFALARLLESQTEALMIVSHLPLLDRLVGVLVTGDPGQILVGFSTAQMVCVEGRDGEWGIV
jgi:phosphohistidine phosphatase